MRRNLHGISSWWRCQDFCGWISAVVLHLLEGIPLAKANQVSGACYIYLVTRKYAQLKSLNRWKEWVGPKAIFYLNRNLKKPIGLKGFSEWSQKWPPLPPTEKQPQTSILESVEGEFFSKWCTCIATVTRLNPYFEWIYFQLYFDWAFALPYARSRPNLDTR